MTQALSPCAINLPPQFSFAEFRRVTPVDEASLWELILERHAERITVKRRDTALENLPKIFGATFRLANNSGFQAMTLRDLCRETGLSMGGLYGYLQSKDQLSEMIEDVIRYLCAMLPEWFANVAAPMDRLEAVLRGHIFLSELFHPWFFFVYMETRSLPQAQRKMGMVSEQGIERSMATMLEQEGGLAENDCLLLAGQALALAQDWHLKRWKHRARKVAVDAYANSVAELVRARVAARI